MPVPFDRLFGRQLTLADQVFEKFSIRNTEFYMLFFYHPVIFTQVTEFVKK